MFKLWYGESDEDARFLTAISDLHNLPYTTQRMYPSDERSFVRNPDLIRDLLLRALIQIGRFHQTPLLGFFWDADQISGLSHEGYLRFDSTFPKLPRRDSEETITVSASLVT